MAGKPKAKKRPQDAPTSSQKATVVEFKVLQSRRFRDWFHSLSDREARARIQARLDRLAAGNPGDWKAVRGGVREMRVDVGPGYRVYFIQEGDRVYFLLAGGDKKTQAADIKTAIEYAMEMKGTPK